jgi:tetratricopeptide (TPR) repeat protein|tara:strand:- start:472 stop:1323 length:852 start_codon:yes stop_codon:yes gene_type:complete
VARRGAGRLEREEYEDRPERAELTAERTTRPRRPEPDRSDRLRTEAAEAISRSAAGRRPERSPRALARIPLPDTPVRLPDADVLFRRAFGDRAGGRALGRLEEAARAFRDERFQDARRILNQLVERADQVPEVLELLGLVHYRMGHWRAGAKRLEVFRELTGSTEQHPVLADCHRAQGRWDDVDALWIELRDASPSASLVTEGRLVAAGAIADQGRLAEAVRLLEKGWKIPSRPRDHHLRRAYALADLYERSGANPRARELFAWIRGHDGGFADVADRVRSLA